MKGNISPAGILERMSSAVDNPGIPSPLVAGTGPYAILVGTVVSLRTRDAVTEVVTKRVLESLPAVADMAAVSVEKLSELLYPAGFYNRKALQLKELAHKLISEHHGEVPADREALEALPGVGGKTAAYVLSMAFGVPAICVDVHVHRISNRLGIVKTDSPAETEKALMLYFPGKLWIPLNHIFVKFGQKICRPQAPLCVECCLKEWCRYAD
jgi:endonuclease-3